MSRFTESLELTPDLLLRAYALGVFPMAESADDPSLHWIEPRMRGILPLDGFHIPRKLAKLVRSERFEVRANHNFDAVIEACAAPGAGRQSTWINHQIRTLYGALFRRGHCHTIEVYEGNMLVGGLYGVSLGGVFFGESMFHRVTDASKVALVHLVARLRAGGFTLLDAQFITKHLAQFGAVEIPRAAYRKKLDEAAGYAARFQPWDAASLPSGADIVRLASSPLPPGTSIAGSSA